MRPAAQAKTGSERLAGAGLAPDFSVDTGPAHGRWWGNFVRRFGGQACEVTTIEIGCLASRARQAFLGHTGLRR
jgi:hypothetical protein